MKHLLAVVCSILILGGCATSRGIVDLGAAENGGTTTAVASVGADAPAVYLNNIVDNRSFELKPRDASIPSLKDGQINNPELTQRAIARKRNGYGMALGDILLPEGQTVTSVVRENLRLVLAEAGYRVLDAPAVNAEPIDVSIDKFWSWFTPGFWAAKVEFRAELNFSGSLQGMGDGDQVTGYVHQRHQAVGSGAWMQTMQAGLDDLRKNLSMGLARRE